MADLTLWNQFAQWKKSCKWVDLSHELSPETPHWDGFPAMEMKTLFDYDTTIFQTHLHSLVGQYGTHVDAPMHFVNGAQTLESFAIDQMVMPLCVIDMSAKVQKNADYTLKIADIEAWESTYGKIPAGAFVAFRSDWSHKGTSAAMDNKDAAGNKHYPGWDLDAIKFLVEQRNIGSIGHETSDTDAPADRSDYAGETYILSQKRFQVEMLTNLDQCPPVGGLIFCTFPKLRKGTGFTARCFALCPKS